MKIRLPKDISRLKVAHIVEIMKIQQSREGDHSVEDMIDYVSLFSNTPKDELMHADISDLQQAYMHCLKVLNTYEPKKPAKTVKVKGVEYKLVPTIKQKGGWYIDVKAKADEYSERPELVAAFCYIEKGMSYSETDKDKNIINPLNARAELFKDHFPADVFLDLNGFFLQKLPILMKGFSILNQERLNEQTKEMMKSLRK